jgi:hypothetical protein
MLKAVSDRLSFTLDLACRRPWAVGSVLLVVAIGEVLIWTGGPSPGLANNARGFEALRENWRLGWWAALPLAIAAMVKLELSFREWSRPRIPAHREDLESG